MVETGQPGGSKHGKADGDLDLMMPGQQQRLLLLVWEQDVMIISKEYAPLGAKVLILLDLS